MKPIFKNIIAVIAGVLIGMGVNMGLIIAGSKLIPLSDGFDPMNATMWELRHFIFPFLAHAIGTLAGAFTAAKLSASYHRILAMSIGIFFLLGGISMVFMLPAPLWFVIADILLAYIPMGWLGWKFSGKER